MGKDTLRESLTRELPHIRQSMTFSSKVPGRSFHFTKYLLSIFDYLFDFTLSFYRCTDREGSIESISNSIGDVGCSDDEDLLSH